MINPFNQTLKSDHEETTRIKQWVRKVMGLSDEVPVMVTELRCPEDDCPDVETVIAVLGRPGTAMNRKHKLLKPMTEVTREDVIGLAARGTHG